MDKDHYPAPDINLIFGMLGTFLDEIGEAFQDQRLSLKYKQISKEHARQLQQALAALHKKALGKVAAEEALATQAAALHLSKISYDVLRLAGLIEATVQGKIRFSEEASREMRQVIEQTARLLPHVKDAFTTGNSLVISHVEKETTSLERKIQENSNLHHERLCKGTCHPLAAGIYAQMLQKIQDILWHYRALANYNKS